MSFLTVINNLQDSQQRLWPSVGRFSSCLCSVLRKCTYYPLAFYKSSCPLPGKNKNLPTHLWVNNGKTKFPILFLLSWFHLERRWSWWISGETLLPPSVALLNTSTPGVRLPDPLLMQWGLFPKAVLKIPHHWWSGCMSYVLVSWTHAVRLFSKAGWL